MLNGLPSEQKIDVNFKSRTLLLQLNQKSGNNSENKANCKKDQSSRKMDAVKGSKKFTLFEKYRTLIKKYGHLIVPVHFLTSTLWFSLIFAAVNSGLKLPNDVEKWTEDDTKRILKIRITKEIAVSLAIFKLVSPMRYGATFYLTHKLIKFLKKRSL